MEAIRSARSKDILVVAVSQCQQGGVSLDLYSMGRDFIEVGVVSGEDLTSEACTTKLAYLFAEYPDDVEKVAKLMRENLRGELTPLSNRRNKYLKLIK
ncbi:hypothetical protein EON65_42360 [archaeon]|nr:MAG: hypothetical protein EON65_42360 [archaeon]